MKLSNRCRLIRSRHTLPAHIPTKTTADVHFRFVSPAVFCASQAYINGVIAARHDTYLVSLVSQWFEDNQPGSPNGGDERKPHDDQALALESSGEPAPTDDGKNLDNPEGDVEENGFKAVIPKGLDDEVAEGTDASAWDSA
ncbi:hypothetical protein BA78_8868 [Aspergillus fumigatus]|nr:hypothetical protein BA78_8868 [Aspergillus fumigatus]